MTLQDIRNVLAVICLAIAGAIYIVRFFMMCAKVDDIHAKLYGKPEPDKHPLAGLTKDPEEES